MPYTPGQNTLYGGDNCTLLRSRFADGCVDLVYLDPPFNSNRRYLMPAVHTSNASNRAIEQIPAFDDTWVWDERAEQAWQQLINHSSEAVASVLQTLTTLLQPGAMLAYLVHMTVCLHELHRVLKPTGNLLLHCDSTVSHYFRMVLESLFGADRFVNEIIWKRVATVKGNAAQGSRTLGSNTDSILCYRKTAAATFHPQYQPYSEAYLKRFYRYVEPHSGRRYRLVSMIGPGGAAKGNPHYTVMGVTRYWRYSQRTMQELIAADMVVQTRPGAVPLRKLYLDERQGVALQTLWDDIPALSPRSSEYTGYPTQKPLALLERLILLSSNADDVVLDPFCGSGTTLVAAQQTGRRWVGIERNLHAIAVQEARLYDTCGLRKGEDFFVAYEQ
jgi:DNA modification methylase